MRELKSEMDALRSACGAAEEARDEANRLYAGALERAEESDSWVTSMAQKLEETDKEAQAARDEVLGLSIINPDTSRPNPASCTLHPEHGPKHLINPPLFLSLGPQPSQTLVVGAYLDTPVFGLDASKGFVWTQVPHLNSKIPTLDTSPLTPRWPSSWKSAR